MALLTVLALGIVGGSIGLAVHFSRDNPSPSPRPNGGTRNTTYKCDRCGNDRFTSRAALESHKRQCVGRGTPPPSPGPEAPALLSDLQRQIIRQLRGMGISQIRAVIAARRAGSAEAAMQWLDSPDGQRLAPEVGAPRPVIPERAAPGPVIPERAVPGTVIPERVVPGPDVGEGVLAPEILLRALNEPTGHVNLFDAAFATHAANPAGNLGVIGMKNYLQTCYMNSALQAIQKIPGLDQALAVADPNNRQVQVIRQFHEFYDDQVQANNRHVIAPRALNNVLRFGEAAADIRSTLETQQDMADSLQNALTAIAPEGLNLASWKFRVMEQRDYTDGRQPARTFHPGQSDHIMILKLDDNLPPISLDYAIRGADLPAVAPNWSSFMAPEVNQIGAENSGHTLTKTPSLARIGSNIIFGLERKNHTDAATKIITAVQYPPVLDVRPYLDPNFYDLSQPINYELYSVIIHTGMGVCRTRTPTGSWDNPNPAYQPNWGACSAHVNDNQDNAQMAANLCRADHAHECYWVPPPVTTGHYQALVKSGDNWFDTNDQDVRQITEAEALNNHVQATMLFYKAQTGAPPARRPPAGNALGTYRSPDDQMWTLWREAGSNPPRNYYTCPGQDPAARWAEQPLSEWQRTLEEV